MSEQGDRPILVAEFPTKALAAIFVATLREEGIEAVTTGGMTAGFRAEAPGMVRVLVHEKDVVRARTLLEIFRQDSKGEQDDQ